MPWLSSFLHKVENADRSALPAALALAVVAGLCAVFAAPAFDFWPLGYVVMVPLLWLVERAPTRRRAMLYCWVTGFVANVGALYWMSSLFTRYAAMPLALALGAVIALATYHGVVFALFALIVRRIREVSTEARGRPLPMVLLAPLTMVACELCVPFIFPWYLGVTQVWVTPVIQVAELAGPMGVTAVVCAVGGAIYDVIIEDDRRRKLVYGLSGAGVLLAVVVFGYVRMHQVDKRRAAAPKLNVGVVQGNFPLDDPDRTYQSDLLKLDELQRVSRDLEKRGAHLIVWSEAIFPFPIERVDGDCEGDRCTYGKDFPNRSAGRVRKGFSAPLIFGAITNWQAEPERTPYNSALMLDGNDQFVGRYDKNYLLIGSEYIPGIKTFPWLMDILPQGAGHFSAGDRVVTFPFRHKGKEYRLGPLICYEDILAKFTRKIGKLHPHLLVNITNDTWFGDTAEPHQHLALSVFRSVEMRTDMVRAVNTGLSAFIDANGRVIKQSYVIDPDKTKRGADGFIGEVALMAGGYTVYAAVGDLFAYICLLVILGLWQVWPRVRRRRAKS